jgi:quercetin dioxygenase-like cupin family protein
MVLNVTTKSSAPEALANAGPPFVQTNLFGGVGEVRVWSLVRGAAEPFTAVLSCELAPGGSVGAHVQQEYPELLLGIDGEGEASVDGRKQRVGALSALYLPLGAVLQIVNRSQDEPLRYLIVKARGHDAGAER